eukprot:TRINITY_DN57740_c0_g1_i1.p1 TRINITY_DN57740_c0_g1~~TRINITY_DN57740_c0_g1_i1.p1  ORF type:complete len:147 (+),score=25.59 TRINITY_DN57740_c0_g1_i1:64-504(+)
MALSDVASSSNECSRPATVSRLRQRVAFSREEPHSEYSHEATVFDEKLFDANDVWDDFDLEVVETFRPCNDEEFAERHAVDCACGPDESFAALETEPLVIPEASAQKNHVAGTNKMTRKFSRPIMPSIPKPEGTFVHKRFLKKNKK